MLKPRTEISTQARYDKIWAKHQEQLREAVEADIEAAIAEHGERINCAFLHRYLRRRYPMAIAWGSVDHVMTEIGGMLFDKNGFIVERVAPEGARPQWFKKSFGWPKTNDFLYDDDATRGQTNA